MFRNIFENFNKNVDIARNLDNCKVEYLAFCFLFFFGADVLFKAKHTSENIVDRP